MNRMPVPKSTPSEDHGGEGRKAPFRLLRYFTLTSFIAIVILTIPFGIFHRRVVVTELLEHGEMHNIAIARAFSNSLWPQFASFVSSASGLSGDAIRSRPETAKLHQAVLVLMRGLSVLKVKIYSLEGLTVFSTEARQIGEDQSGNPGFLGARSGKVVSLLTHRGEFYSFEGGVQDRDVLTTYFPIRSGNPAKPLDGVVEVYRDVTPLVREVSRAQAREWIAVISPLAILYISLFFIVRYADRVIKRQDAEGRQRENQLRLERERLSVLNEVNVVVTSTLDLKEVLNGLLEKIDRLIPFAACSLSLMNPASGKLEPLAVRNLDLTELKALSERSGGGLRRIVLESKSPLVIANVQADSKLPLVTEFFVKHGLVSYLGLPLVAKGEVIGTLSLITKEEHEFSDEEVKYLATLAGQAATAIHNSRLYEQTKKQAVELEKAREMEADFTAMLVHDLRSPLMAVLSGAAILEDGLEGPVNEAQKKWLARIEAGVRKVVDLVNDFLDLSKIEAGRIELEKKEIDLGQLIRESIENYHALAKRKQIALQSYIDSSFPRIKADPRYLDQVLSNLLSNAIKFTPEGGAIELGTARESKGEVKVWVKDTGVGIPPHEMENLFEKYRQTASGKGSSQKGTGLGLVISKKIVEAHGGKIWVETEENKGTTFYFSLPVNA